MEIVKVTGIGEYVSEDLMKDDKKVGVVYRIGDGGKAFCVIRDNTVEFRTDRNLSKLLREKYESVMESRYFGRGGIEVVNSGQLSEDEIYDLIRLSYNMSAESEE